MKLAGILPFARELLQKSISEGGIAVDATAGKGNDTAFLAKLVGEFGVVYSFDVQAQAIEATKTLLQENHLEKQVNLIHDGHENLLSHLSSSHYENIDGAIFNLGYLPGSDKSIATSATTTIDAIEQLLKHLKKEGIIVLVIYHGHEEGKREKDHLLPFVKSIPQESFHVMEYRFINQKNDPPFIIAIEKR